MIGETILAGTSARCKQAYHWRDNMNLIIGLPSASWWSVNIYCPNCWPTIGAPIIVSPILAQSSAVSFDSANPAWDWLVIERNIFFLLQLIWQANTCSNFYRKSYCFPYNSAITSVFDFSLNPSIKHELYSPTNRKYLIFWFRIKLSPVILATARIFFSNGSSKTSSQRLNFQYFFKKILWNFVELLFFHMLKVWIKQFI